MYKNHHAHSITMIEYTERQKNFVKRGSLSKKMKGSLSLTGIGIQPSGDARYGDMERFGIRFCFES